MSPEKIDVNGQVEIGGTYLKKDKTLKGAITILIKLLEKGFKAVIYSNKNRTDLLKEFRELNKHKERITFVLFTREKKAEGEMTPGEFGDISLSVMRSQENTIILIDLNLIYNAYDRAPDELVSHIDYLSGKVKKAPVILLVTIDPEQATEQVLSDLEYIIAPLLEAVPIEAAPAPPSPLPPPPVLLAPKVVVETPEIVDRLRQLEILGIPFLKQKIDDLIRKELIPFKYLDRDAKKGLKDALLGLLDMPDAPENKKLIIMTITLVEFEILLGIPKAVELIKKYTEAIKKLRLSLSDQRTFAERLLSIELSLRTLSGVHDIGDVDKLIHEIGDVFKTAKDMESKGLERERLLAERNGAISALKSLTEDVKKLNELGSKLIREINAAIIKLANRLESDPNIKFKKIAWYYVYLKGSEKQIGRLSELARSVNGLKNVETDRENNDAATEDAKSVRSNAQRNLDTTNNNLAAAKIRLDRAKVTHSTNKKKLKITENKPHTQLELTAAKKSVGNAQLEIQNAERNLTQMKGNASRAEAALKKAKKAVEVLKNSADNLIKTRMEFLRSILAYAISTLYILYGWLWDLGVKDVYLFRPKKFWQLRAKLETEELYKELLKNLKKHGQL